MKKSLRSSLGILLGKSSQIACKAVGRGNSFPGMVTEKIDGGFLPFALNQLPLGTLVVCGTNGKTTTARLLAGALESLGIRVISNESGANFTRGIISTLLSRMSFTGKLNYDMAVFELDEAWAPLFCRQVKPTYALILNCSRDQLDRYGERDSVAKLLGKVASGALRGVVLNGGDERVSSLSSLSSSPVFYYDFNPSLAKLFPKDEDLICMRPGAGRVKTSGPKAGVILKAVEGRRAVFEVEGEEFSCSMGVEGSFNFLNAAGAIAAILAISSTSPQLERMKRLRHLDFSPRSAIGAVAEVHPAFGRGEEFCIGGNSIKVVLVKNPVGFSSALASIPLEGKDVMVALNDQSADGRDVSWIYDVDYSCLSEIKDVTGERAYDMALCLEYNGKKVRKAETDAQKALRDFLSGSNDKVIFTSYTSMLRIRKILLAIDGSKGRNLYAAD